MFRVSALPSCPCALSSFVTSEEWCVAAETSTMDGDDDSASRSAMALLGAAQLLY